MIGACGYLMATLSGSGKIPFSFVHYVWRMFAYVFRRVLLLWLIAGLAGCASAPERINDICAVFDQNDGFFNNWQRTAADTERKYGIPVPVLMATISQGIRLPVECPSAARLLSRFHSRQAGVKRLWLFAGAGRNLGAVQGRKRQLRRTTVQLRGCGRFRRLVPRKDRRRLRAAAGRHDQPLPRLLCGMERLQERRLARQRQRAEICQGCREDGGRLQGAVAGLPRLNGRIVTWRPYRAARRA